MYYGAQIQIHTHMQDINCYNSLQKFEILYYFGNKFH